MPLYFQARRRKRTLRRQIAEKNVSKLINDDEDDISVVSKRSSDTLSSTPASLTGSFLRNKLDNPLFKPFFSRRHRKVQNQDISYDVSDSEEDNSSDSEDESLSEESQIEHRWRLFRSKRHSHARKFGSSFFARRNRKQPRSKLRLQLRISSDSSNSSISKSSFTENDSEVELLTNLEDENANLCNSSNKGHLLYSSKGQAVRVQFCFDYLHISPVIYKLSLSRQKAKPKIVYYEDLVLWTNNDDCLRLIHMKNKDTKLQERSEIKLFLSKKKKTVTIQQLNDELKDRISLLMTSKLNIKVEEAKKLLQQRNTTEDVNRVVQAIDRDTEKSLAQNFSPDVEENNAFALLNV